MASSEVPCSIQFASDLHLEGVFGSGSEPPEDLIVPSAMYLVLAGDICTLTSDMIPRYKAWLRRIAEGFEKVFVLAGNHEFYGVSLEEGRAALSEICASDPRLFFLDRTRVCLQGDVVLLGCTLWSHVPRHAEAKVLGLLNDYRVIKPAAATDARVSPIEDAKRAARDRMASRGGTGLPSLVRSIHAELSAEYDRDLGWLTEEIALASRLPVRVVVATHHAPTFQAGLRSN